MIPEELKAHTYTERETAIYFIGHDDGESCRSADYDAEFERVGLADEVDAWDTRAVAEYVRGLVDALSNHRTENP